MQDADDLLIIGRIITGYGVKGWVKVKSFTQPQTNFLGYKNCFVHKNGSWQVADIERGKEHGKGLVVKFKGFEDLTAAEALFKCDVAVRLDELPALPEEDFYWHQLEGLRVNTGEQFLGKVSHLLETGSNDVLVVKACEGSIDKRERLLPYRPEVVLQVDLETSTMLVDWDPEF